MRQLLLFICLIPCIISCTDSDDCQGFKLDQEFEMAINETIENCPENITATLSEIQDSRCPMGGECIWEGMIVIQGEMTIKGKTYALQLSNNQQASGFPPEFSASKYTVKLIDAIPYSDLHKTQNPEDKRAILVISKRST